MKLAHRACCGVQIPPLPPFGLFLWKTGVKLRGLAALLRKNRCGWDLGRGALAEVLRAAHDGCTTPFLMVSAVSRPKEQLLQEGMTMVSLSARVLRDGARGSIRCNVAAGMGQRISKFASMLARTGTGLPPSMAGLKTYCDTAATARKMGP